MREGEGRHDGRAEEGATLESELVCFPFLLSVKSEEVTSLPVLMLLLLPSSFAGMTYTCQPLIMISRST